MERERGNQGESTFGYPFLAARSALGAIGKNPSTFGICIAHFGRTAPTSVPSFDSEPILRCPCHLCIAPPYTASPIDKTDIGGIGHLSTNVNHIYPTFTPIRRHCRGVQFFAACKKIKLTLWPKSYPYTNAKRVDIGQPSPPGCFTLRCFTTKSTTLG
jgi:hypothetical protein